jgi:hypothetical protein
VPSMLARASTAMDSGGLRGIATQIATEEACGLRRGAGRSAVEISVVLIDSVQISP